MAMTNGNASSSTGGESPPEFALAALPTGHRLKEYSLDGVLGSGGFGITYLATDRNLKCHVAIKEYLPSDQAMRTDGTTLEPRPSVPVEAFQLGLSRFLDEARALATFNHPNIVRVLRFFKENGTGYMVMELVTGLPLREWVKQHRPLSEAQLLAIIRPLLDGLRMIHAAGFVHRDIKPGNVHMRTDTHPVLLDFGAARQLMKRNGRELTAIVTPGYAAFEQYHTQGNQGPWTDLYSVAALMYGLVTGQRPVEAPARIRSDPLVSALDAADRTLYSETLLRAIDWGLAPEEERRPQSVDEFAAKLPSSAPSIAAAAERPAAPTYASSGPSSGPPSLDPRVLGQIEAALAQHLGPVAAVLVRRLARTSETVEGLRAALADEIDDESARVLFMERTESLIEHTPSASEGTILATRVAPNASNSAGSAKPRFDEAFLTAVESELALHLGPLARVLIKKYAGTARDRAELFLLLSDNIADPGKRRAFIRKSVAAFKDKR